MEFTDEPDIYGEGTFFADNTGNIISVSESFCNLTGYSHEELADKNISDIITRILGDEYFFNFKTGISPDKKRSDILLRKKDSSEIWLRTNAYRMSECCIRYITTDITDLKEKKEELINSKNILETIFDNIPCGMVIIGEDYRIHSVNKKTCEITGYSSEELTGEFCDIICPKGKESKECPIWEKNKKSFDGMETAVKCKGGYRNPVLKNAELVQLDSRNYILEIFQDLSVLKEAENRLRRSEIRYRELFQNSPTGILLIDRDGEIIDMNPAAVKIYGSPSPEETRSRINVLNHPQLKKTAEKFRECLSEDKIISYEEYYTTIWGRKLYLRYDASQNHDEFNTIRDVTVNVQDLTDRKKDETELEEKNEILRELNEKLTLTEEEMIEQLYEITEMQKALTLSNKKLNILSAITRHDILNQITVLRGYLELASESKDYASSKIFFDKMDSAAERIQNQIEFTGDYEELGISEPKWHKISDVIRKLRNKKIAVKNRCGELEIFADSMLEKVFYNLMDNSIRYAGESAEITLTCKICSSGAKVYWMDNGTGVPNEEKEKIFQRGVGKNTGFGLFLIREILSITDIEIQETGVYGEGACFEITVPKDKYRW
ncbi:PAS domain-containing sensor histidine kinase [Methanoplanus limicola]|uniref:histidine kinase n=1 Tax=Methanoplanus limicola DSM 2279 TaxID=937775 RepID=H1Z109_9EURY|nr:PAS domain-containing sensor histidine kinase [Methanoplanus limicola]EHQ34485.1 PAS/PAC sensor signal transduction histidine kinase [Methanoplanus limicola DSM 2279]